MITVNENNYFRFNFKKATNLCKRHLLPKIRFTEIFARSFLDDQSFPTVEPLRKKFWNSWTTI